MKNKRENGEVVVEASIVVTIVVILISVMLYIGMILYQQSLVSIMANQTASNIAQVYSNNLKDPFTGYVDPDRVYQTITYSSMKTDAYMDVIEQKANLLAKYRLKSSKILATDNTSVEIDIVKKPNELLKSQIVVTIRDSYEVPLVGLFGADGLVEFGGVGRADCVDILEYIYGVEAIGDPEGSNITPMAETCTVTFVPDRSNMTSATSVNVLKGKTILSSNRYTHCVMPANPQNKSWEFCGWVDETGRPFTGSTTVNGNMVVYGSWKCTITLHAEGGKVNANNTYTFKAVVGNRTSIPNATRAAYNFAGWFTQKGGRGTRYLSNDTVINGDVTLYAHWACAHPVREEYKRDGNVCEGGTIYYRCKQCHADLGVSGYPGNGHSFRWRCNRNHYVNTFSGYGSGGCGYFHYRDDRYSANNRYGLAIYRHSSSKPWMYCPVCKYCHKSTSDYFICGTHGAGRTPCEPSNGHQR